MTLLKGELPACPFGSIVQDFWRVPLAGVACKRPLSRRTIYFPFSPVRPGAIETPTSAGFEAIVRHN